MKRSSFIAELDDTIDTRQIESSMMQVSISSSSPVAAFACDGSRKEEEGRNPLSSPEDVSLLLTRRNLHCRHGNGDSADSLSSSTSSSSTSSLLSGRIRRRSSSSGGGSSSLSSLTSRKSYKVDLCSLVNLDQYNEHDDIAASSDNRYRYHRVVPSMTATLVPTTTMKDSLLLHHHHDHHHNHDWGFFFE